MNFLQYIAFAIFLAATFELSAPEEAEFKTFHIRPQPIIYSMHIREFHECVSCNSNDSARRDFVNCLRGLSEENKKLVKSCCTNVFDDQFCQNASHGEINFGLICNDTMKGIDVERCFWKRTNKNIPDIEELRAMDLIWAVGFTLLSILLSRSRTGKWLLSEMQEEYSGTLLHYGT